MRLVCGTERVFTTSNENNRGVIELGIILEHGTNIPIFGSVKLSQHVILTLGTDEATLTSSLGIASGRCSTTVTQSIFGSLSWWGIDVTWVKPLKPRVEQLASENHTSALENVDYIRHERNGCRASRSGSDRWPGGAPGPRAREENAHGIVLHVFFAYPPQSHEYVRPVHQNASGYHGGNSYKPDHSSVPWLPAVPPAALGGSEARDT